MSFPFNFNLQYPSGVIAFWFAVLAIIWLVVLAVALNRNDMHPSTQFMWVFVLVSMNILGVLLYWMIAPSREFLDKMRESRRPVEPEKPYS